MNKRTKFIQSSQTGAFIVASLVVGSLTLGMQSTIAKPLPGTRPIAQRALPPAAPGSGVYAPNYNNNFSGTVERYLLNKEGLVDGLLLNDGLQVKFPPHMSDYLSQAVRPGNRVTVIGTPGVATSLGQEIHAHSITNAQNQATVVRQSPRYVARPVPPADTRYDNFSASGIAQRWLIGRRGEIKGVVLSSGAQVKFPRHVGYQLTNLARQGARIEAQGFGSRNSYGQVLEAVSLSVNGQALPVYGAAPLR